MSVLETPRIYFRGQAAWDPIVTNNHPKFYNETTSETVLPDALNRVAAFRREAVEAVSPSGRNWNPHGTHRSTFFDSAVSGADLGAGVVQNDPFVGSPASFSGMLVDLEPYGTFSSQLFFDTMSFGIDGGYRILAPRSARFTARYINMGRNLVGAIAGIASVVWQTSFAKADGLRIDAFDSPSLQALQRALEAADVLGLTVQWNAYRTIYFNKLNTSQPTQQMYDELTAKLNGGGFQPNPARSMVVGVIGLWRKGEPIHEPGDRVLITGPDDPQSTRTQRVPTVGSIHARLTEDSITLDLSNSISETGLDLTKNNFGELTVAAIDPNSGQPVTLASFDYSHYDKDAYERTAGIITLPVPPTAATMASSAELQLRNATGQVLLAEAALRAVPLVPNLYMNQGEAQTARFQVYSYGALAGAGVEVTIGVMSADGGTVEGTSQLTTAADGTVSFPLNASTGGIVAYVAMPGPNPAPPTQGLDPQVYTYMYARTLPADEGVARLPPTWENVYSQVLSSWHAMAPCMDNWLDLGNEAQVRSYAPLLKKLTNEAAFESYRFMPVTRDMTAGRRALLYNFLDNPPPPAAKGDAEESTAAAPDQPPYFVSMSRKMRSQ